jgi:adenylate kinase family enzyme
VTGLRYDPMTNRLYHLKFDPPPKNNLIESRLVQKPSDSEEATMNRLNIYRKNVKGIMDTWKTKYNVLSYPEGIMGNEQHVFKEVFNILGRRPVSRAPRSYKIILAGLPGSGKTKIANLLHQKYGFVNGII